MASQIREAFTKVAGHVNFDRALAKRLSGFQTGFVAKNEEHMAFFGGNLTGAHIVRFTSQDRDKFFIDIVNVDELELDFTAGFGALWRRRGRRAGKPDAAGRQP